MELKGSIHGIPLILILIFSNMGSLANGTIEADFSGTWTETLEDRDGDGLAEALVIGVDIDVYVPGSYGIFGSVNDGEIVSNSGLVSLGLGNHRIVLKFPGADIITRGTSGQYEITLELYTSDPGSTARSREITTRESYDPADFERGEGFPGTSVTVEGPEVLINNPLVEIRINTTRPLLVFSYPGELSRTTRAALECISLVAYDDQDGNTAFDPGVDTVKYSTDLARDVDWKMNLDLSRGFRIDLQGMAPMRRTGSPSLVAWASLTITMDSTTIDPQGSSQKFDIDIELFQPLDSDGIAIVQELRDESGGHEFRYSEDQPYRTISLVDGTGKVNGMYTWVDDILVGEYEADTPSKAFTGHELGQDRAMVVFSYPLENDTLRVFHDPRVGMDPKMPEIRGEDPFLSNRPLLMGAGFLLGTSLVIGAIIITRLRRRW